MSDLASSGASPSPNAVRRIPWRDIARRLAAGAQPAQAAAEFGLQEERIWRHLRRSLRFRFYLQQALERQRLLAGLQLAAAAPGALVSRGLQPESLDGDGLRLLREAGRPESGDIGSQVEQLGATGDPPPNMAWRSRLAAEKRGMDLQAAEAYGFVAGLETGFARAARRAQPTAQAPAAAVAAGTRPASDGTLSAPNGTLSVPNGTLSASSGTLSVPNGTRSAANGTLSAPSGTLSTPHGTQSAWPGALSSRHAAPAVPDPQRPAATPEDRPPRAPPAEPPRAIVDIEGPDRAKLAASGALQRPVLPSG